MARPDAQYGSLAFEAQIEHFRQKVSLPSQGWTDLWEGMHARAFVVAGAMRDDLVADLRQAVDQAISGGTTLAQFRRQFDKAVGKHGWDYTGGRDWRSRLIYDTNLRTSYQTGRYKQLKAVAKVRPYWRYRHSDAVVHPRKEHLAWDGLTLRHDDPWWDTHYPPNGWGCQCYVDAVSERELARAGDRLDTAPPLNLQKVTVGPEDARRTVEVPEGIDPGWAYNPGQAAWGSSVEEFGAYRRVEDPNEQSAESLRLRPLPVDPVERRGPVPADDEEVAPLLARAVGGTSVDAVFKAPSTPFRYGIHVDTVRLAREMSGEPQRRGRVQFAPLLLATLTNPAEVWLHTHRRADGRVALRVLFVRAVAEAADRFRPYVVVADAQNGQLVGWNALPRQVRDLRRLRSGHLLYSRERGSGGD